VSGRPISTGSTQDPRTQWWVHDGCGWPTEAWFAGTGAVAPPGFDGTPAAIARFFSSRPDVEAKWRPLPRSSEVRDLAMLGKTFVD
jgi:hypothetical protein